MGDEVADSRGFLEIKYQLLDILNFAESTSVSKFDLIDDEFFYSALSKAHFGSETYLGHGHSHNPIVAASKAFGESLERFLAFQYMNGKREMRPVIYRIECEKGMIRVFDDNVQTEMPPKSLQSSNGWALHFSRTTSIKNAVYEALERTSLQATFIAEGWKGFGPQGDFQIQGRDLRAWLTCRNFFGYYGGLFECNLLNSQGRTFGYFLHPDGHPYLWNRYVHSAFEALEPSIYMDNHSAYRPNPADAIAILQFELARRPEVEIFKHRSSVETFKMPKNLSASVYTFDLSKEFNIDFPLYLSWCFGGNTIPLILKSKLDHGGRLYLQEVLGNYGLNYDESYEVPVI